MNETKLILGVLMRLRWWEDSKLRVRKASGLLPDVDAALRTRSQDNGRLFRAGLAFGI